MLQLRKTTEPAPGLLACLPETRIGPSALFGETRTEPLAFLTERAHRTSGEAWPETTSDLCFFTQEDPIRLAGGDVNIYRYVANRVTSLADPLGLCVLLGTEPPFLMFGRQTPVIRPGPFRPSPGQPMGGPRWCGPQPRPVVPRPLPVELPCPGGPAPPTPPLWLLRLADIISAAVSGGMGVPHGIAPLMIPPQAGDGGAGGSGGHGTDCPCVPQPVPTPPLDFD